MPLPIIGIALEELAGELLGGAIDDTVGSSDLVPEQAALESKSPVFRMATASTPGIGLAMKQVLDVINRRGEIGESELIDILSNHGVQDKIGDFEKFSKAALADKDATRKALELAESVAPENFGKRGTKAVRAQEQFLEGEFQKDVKKAKASKKAAGTRFKNISSELAREADEVKGKPLQIAPDAGKVKTPKGVGSQFVDDVVSEAGDKDFAKSLNEFSKQAASESEGKATKGAKKGLELFDKIPGKRWMKIAALLGAGVLLNPFGDDEEDEVLPEEDTSEQDAKEIKEGEAMMRALSRKSSGSASPKQKRKDQALEDLEKIKQDILDIGRRF